MACAVAAMVALTSCAPKRVAEGSKEHFEIDKTYERGPLKFSVKVSKKEITIAERVRLVLEALADEGYEVELPKFGDKLHEFGIVDYISPPPKLVGGGKVRIEKSYVLEPFLSGEYKIPPMKVLFWQRPAGDVVKAQESKKHELETEELTVKVTSLLPEKAAKLAIKDIAGPVELPAASRAWLWWVFAGCAGGGSALVAILLWWLRRKRAEAPLPKFAAHEIAYHRLEALLAEKLIETGQVKLFYQRLSDVLRHYIEHRFGLHAPERTTEEFLDELRTSQALEERFRPLLGEFLTHCDLVKFAEHRPTNAEIQRAFDACKEFIEATKVEEKTVEVSADAA